MTNGNGTINFPRIIASVATIVMLLIGGIAFTGTASAQDANKGCPDGLTVPDGMHCEDDGNGGFTVVVDSATDACANVTVPTGYKCENGNVVVDNGSGTDGSGNGGANNGFFNPTGYCTLGADNTHHALAFDGTTRIWMDDALATDIKNTGGTCVVELGKRVVFTYNSIEGQLLVDGQHVTKGNGMLTAGSKFEAKYGANNGANGFDLWVDLDTDPSTVNNAGTTPPLSGTPDTTAVASATCTGGGKSWTLAYDANKGVLYMNDFIAEARTVNKTNAITCTLTTTVDGIVKINGGNVTFPAGSTTYTFAAGTPENDFGFSWEKTTA